MPFCQARGSKCTTDKKAKKLKIEISNSFGAARSVGVGKSIILNHLIN